MDCIENHLQEGEPIPGQPENRLPIGSVWVEGDNKDESTDSRTYGPLPLGLVKGIVQTRVCTTECNVAIDHDASSASDPFACTV
jgi:type IV secretory pathway protease TraF